MDLLYSSHPTGGDLITVMNNIHSINIFVSVCNNSLFVKIGSASSQCKKGLEVHTEEAGILLFHL